MENSTVGSFNVAVGQNTMENTDSGSFNTAVGYLALRSNAKGDQNTALGSRAGDNLISGRKNIIIGADVDFPSTTDSNQLNIGNIIYGVDIDGIGSTLSTGNIGIGTQTPTHKLDINGQTRIRTINDTNDVAGILTANDSGVIQNIPYDTLLAKINDSSEWIDGSLVGLTAGNIYARKALNNGDTVVIDTSGKLGIGTNNPMRDLHISNSAPTLTLENSSNTNTINMRVLADGSSLIRFKDESSKGRNYDIGTGTLFTDTGSLVIRDVTSSSRRFVIDSTGFIGIGNIIPTKKIDVNGEARIRTINDTTDAAGILTANASGVIMNLPIDSLINSLNNDSTSDHDWHEVGTSSSPTNINSDIFTYGAVGIGTNTIFPDFDLIIRDSTSNARVAITSVDTTFSPSLFLANELGNLWYMRKASRTDASAPNSFQIVEDNTGLPGGGTGARFTIDIGGNIGLSTLQPTHRLDVNGETRIRTINDTNDVAGVLTANAQGVVQNIPYDTLLAKINDSSEW